MADILNQRLNGLSWKAKLFVILVAIPTFLATLYYGLFAADQYVTEFRFSLRSGSNPMSQSASMASGMAVNPAIIWDSHSIVQFIKGREVVDDLQKKIDLRKIYSSPKADFLTRLNPKVPAENLAKYWQGVVEPYFDMNTGIISVKVRAFSPQESQLIAKTLLAQSEQLINSMTERAREDSLKYSTAEVNRAGNALAETDAAIRDMRNKYGLLDPNRTATLEDNVQSKQSEQLAVLEAQYQSVLKSVGPNSPMLPSLRSQINAIQSGLKKEQSTKTQSSDDVTKKDKVVMSDILSHYNELVRQLGLRERAYSSAQEALQRARIDVDRQQLYLNAFEHPALPEIATYPNRTRSIFIIFAFALLAWVLTCLGVYAVHDHV